MCDVSSIRKVVIFFGIVHVLASPEPEPQLNIPLYPSTTPIYGNTYSKNDINRNYPQNPQYDYPARKNQDYDYNRDVYNRGNVPRIDPSYNVAYPDQPGYSSPRPIDPDGPRNEFPGGYRDNFDPNDPDYRYKNRSPYRGDVRGLLQALDLQASQQCTANVAAQWNFETNVNEATQLEALSAGERRSAKDPIDSRSSGLYFPYLYKNHPDSMEFKEHWCTYFRSACTNSDYAESPSLPDEAITPENKKTSKSYDHRIRLRERANVNRTIFAWTFVHVKIVIELDVIFASIGPKTGTC
ncbi:hypothetical protein HHI36_012075 [Cryptolaemus montrouzieri]|uniref:Uncharacterized protein n=1 Tax=Cryptolaemus montrouzieri TaxID=559131 RepID=A0ABD2ND67_9CUCU